MRGKHQSPCLTCLRVDNPNACENKTCKEWKKWFLGRWAMIHGYGCRHQGAQNR